MNAVAVGRRLRERRLELGLSQRELAEPGVTYAYLSRIESGTRNPSLTALIKVACKLGVTALWLLKGRDDCVCPLCGRGPKEES